MRTLLPTPADIGPSVVLQAIHSAPLADQKTGIMWARAFGLIDDEQTQVLIRELGLAAA